MPIAHTIESAMLREPASCLPHQLMTEGNGWGDDPALSFGARLASMMSAGSDVMRLFWLSGSAGLWTVTYRTLRKITERRIQSCWKSHSQSALPQTVRTYQISAK